MTKPKALDLFCGAGGASAGLARAGFDVLGFDRDPQPNYPFRFMQIDVRLIQPSALRAFDLIWASPPCQGRTAYKRRPNHVADVDTDGMIELTRRLLRKSGVTRYIIENVPGAPLLDPITLCGSMFRETRDIRRHRWFEASFRVFRPPCHHEVQSQARFPPATNRKNLRRTVEIGVWRIPLEIQRAAMGIDWMGREELSQAIPPAYAEFLARQAPAPAK